MNHDFSSMRIPAINPSTEKVIIAVLGILGIPCVAYGMMTDNHPIFITGLVLVVMAYLLIRRRLKLSNRDMGRDTDGTHGPR